MAVVVVVVVWGQDPVVADAAPPSPRHLGESASAGQCTSRRGHQVAQVSCPPCHTFAKLTQKITYVWFVFRKNHRLRVK